MENCVNNTSLMGSEVEFKKAVTRGKLKSLCL
jgi:hypothetical protein